MYHNIYAVPAQEEVILRGMGDVGIDGRPRRHVARSSRLIALVRAEEASVVPLLHRDQRDPWHVVGLQLREKSMSRWKLVKWSRTRSSRSKSKVEMLELGTLTQASLMASNST